MINPENDRNLHKLLLSLNHKLSPTVYFISCNTERLRKLLYESITSGAPRFKHLYIDLTPHSVYSLRDAISQFVPGEVRKSAVLTYVIHFTGISSSLFTSDGGEFKKSMLLEELNFERETLFQDYPFISFLWVNPFFYKELFWKAGDLMSWVFDRYEFTDESPEGVTNEIPYKETLQGRGAIAERTERIKELGNLLERLDEENPDQQKVMLEKANACLLLGREYMEAFGWREAEEYLFKAKYLIGKTNMNSCKELEVMFHLGRLYLITNRLDEAFLYYQEALKIAEKNSIKDVGAIYHNIGLLFRKQMQWDKALVNYKKALEWKEKTGNEYLLGETFHELGNLYWDQGLWENALENYYEAVQWYKNTGKEYELGDTYHQIGFTFQKQQKWKEALNNYFKAIEFHLKTKNEFELGKTYHQIGMCYQEQNNLEDALTTYQKAIEWKEKTGNEYALGITYHQIGRVYEEQKLPDKAKLLFEMAVKNMHKYNHPNLGIAESSLQRVNAVLTVEKTETS